MLSDFCQCTKERREQEENFDCYHCQGTGEGATPDVSCSWCHGSGIAKTPSFWCNTCEKEIQDPNVFGDDDGEENKEEEDSSEVNE